MLKYSYKQINLFEIMIKNCNLYKITKEKKTMTNSQTIKYYCGKVHVHKFYMTVQ